MKKSLRIIVSLSLALFISVGAPLFAQDDKGSQLPERESWKDACAALIAKGDAASRDAAKEMLAPLAEKGDSTAQFVLGMLTENKEWVKKAADAGQADALWIQDKWELKPSNGSLEEYGTLLKKAAQNGHETAKLALMKMKMTHSAVVVENPREENAKIPCPLSKKDIKELTALAKKGYMQAQVLLAETQLWGICDEMLTLDETDSNNPSVMKKKVKKIAKRVTDAFTKLEKAAEYGYAQAISTCIDCNTSFTGYPTVYGELKRDVKKLSRMINLAIDMSLDQKDKFPMCGELWIVQSNYIARREGVDASRVRYSFMLNKNEICAFTHEELKQAAESGDPQAQFYMGEQAINTYGGKGAADWFQKAADQGYAPAQWALYQLSSKDWRGPGRITKGQEKAEEWCREAADQGFTFAMISMAKLSIEKGQWEEAEKRCQKLIAQGSISGHKLLGDCYAAQGRKNDALQCYQKSIEQKNMNAALSLAILHAGKCDGEVNRNEALKWLNQYIKADGLNNCGTNFVQVNCLLSLLR